MKLSMCFKAKQKQPRLDTVYRSSSFEGYYFLAGLNAHLNSRGTPYWEIILQDAFGAVSVFATGIDDITSQLMAYSPLKVQCSLRRVNSRKFFHADRVVPVNDIPMQCKNVNLIPFQSFVFHHHARGLVDLAEKVAFEPLRRFISQVIVQPQTMLAFIRNPASARHHHSYPGGLLDHSLEVANNLAIHFADGSIERDIAITAGLLHDVGKTRTLFETPSLTTLGKLVEHDDLTLEICSTALRELDYYHPDIADQLRHTWTCASPNARYGYKAKTDVAKKLQYVDRINSTNDNIQSICW